MGAVWLRRLIVVVLLAGLVAVGEPSGASGSVAASGDDAGVTVFGDAIFHGSMSDVGLAQPVVGMASTPGGDGYWLAAADGGVFAFGDAAFVGSMGGVGLNAPVVGMAATPSGDGYWLAAADGGVFAFGDASHLGSGVERTQYVSVVGMAATPSGAGYWLVSSGACAFPPTTDDRSSLPLTHFMLLTDVRTGDHECHERIVFDFDADGFDAGRISYHHIGYRDPPFVGTPGDPIDVDGSAFLEIVLWRASGYDIEELEPTYTGPEEIKPADLEFVREIQLLEDFEATLVWVIGLDQRRAFNVFELDDPDRLVIDIGPPAPSQVTTDVFFTPSASVAADCSIVAPVQRSVRTPDVRLATVEALLEGPTAAERAAGSTSWFGPSTAGMVNSERVLAGTAYVDFEDFSALIPGASSSCGSAMLLAQLDATMTQFPTVDRTLYSFDGDVGAFYRWLQRDIPDHA